MRTTYPDDTWGYRVLPSNAHHAPPVWRVPAGSQGLAGLRADAPSEARGADGERAGEPDGARNTGGADGERAGEPDGARNTGGADGERAGEPDGARNTGGAATRNTSDAAAMRVCERPGGESPPPGLYTGLTCR